MICSHHWKIESPAPERPILDGCCKLCGAEKKFAAVHDDRFNRAAAAKLSPSRPIGRRFQGL